MFYYILMTIVGLAFVLGVILFILRRKGFRIFQTDEQRETEEGIRKAFGKTTRWGFPGGAESETRDHNNHSHHSDYGGGHDGGSSDGGGGGGGD